MNIVNIKSVPKSYSVLFCINYIYFRRKQCLTRAKDKNHKKFNVIHDFPYSDNFFNFFILKI